MDGNRVNQDLDNFCHDYVRKLFSSQRIPLIGRHGFDESSLLHSSPALARFCRYLYSTRGLEPIPTMWTPEHLQCVVETRRQLKEWIMRKAC
jgi:hypothetical protein